jgi:Ca-activated chloride channel family protein
MSMQFLQHEYLLLGWILPILGGILILHMQRQAGKRARLLHQSTGSSPSLFAGVIKHILLFIGLGLCIIGLARPVAEQEPTTVKRQGRDVVFMLDVSRSMLAQDLAPNRLERAKLAILDCIDRLQGDRVGLVAFAGSAIVRCPLTLDYGFFKQMLEDTRPDLAVKGGTNIGDTLRTIHTDVFDNQLKAYKDIIIISDGGDHDSFPVNAAESLGDEGIRLIVIGLGDKHTGQPIPLAGKDNYLEYEGKRVLTRLDSDSLQSIGLATPGGIYLEVGTGSVDLGEVYMDLIRSQAKREFGEETINTYQELYGWFLACGILFITLDLLAEIVWRRQHG